MNKIKSDWEIKEYCRNLHGYWDDWGYDQCKDKLRTEANFETGKIVGENIIFVVSALFRLVEIALNKLKHL